MGRGFKGSRTPGALIYVMASSKIVDIGALLGGGRRQVDFEQPVELEPFEGWSFPRPAAVRLQIRGVDRLIEVAGTIDVEAHGDCDRCLEDVNAQMHLEVLERLEPPVTVKDDPFSESNVISGDRLDVADLTRQLVDSSAPFAVLCDMECKGLCPHCGANLNDGACDCADQERS